MKRLNLVVIVTALWMSVTLPAAAQNNAKAVAATPQNAAAFLGEWAITANGSYGDITATLVLKAADGKVAGEITDTNGKHQLSDISKSGDALVAYYVFDYNGMPIDAVVTVAPNEKEKRTDAYFEFANGAAQFAGTATKK
jgi:hypothetical protein